jgi:alpha-galactosidase
MVERLCRRDMEANGVPARLTAALDRRAAVRDARYVFCVARVGGIEAFRQDIDVPLRDGVGQCVGDTLGPGGIFCGQRGIPAMLEFCRDIREAAAPDCLLLNCSNPMATMTWATNQCGGVRTVGLCHGVQGGHHQIAEVLGLPQYRPAIAAACRRLAAHPPIPAPPGAPRGSASAPSRNCGRNAGVRAEWCHPASA